MQQRAMAAQHDGAISRPGMAIPRAAARRLGEAWMPVDDMPLAGGTFGTVSMLRSPTFSHFEPLSPVAPLSPLAFTGLNHNLNSFFLKRSRSRSRSKLHSRSSSLPENEFLPDKDFFRLRPPTSGSDSYHPLPPAIPAVPAIPNPPVIHRVPLPADLQLQLQLPDLELDNLATSTSLFSSNLDTFFLSTPSRTSLASYTTTVSESGTVETDPLSDSPPSSVKKQQQDASGEMPTRAASDDAGSVGPFGHATVIGGTNDDAWRPRSAGSKTAGSPSPLFKGWTTLGGAKQHNHDMMADDEPPPTTEPAGGMRNSRSPGLGLGLGWPKAPPLGEGSNKSATPSPLTREEFEALPPAIQRKYFSTLERLRFAQNSSGMVDGIFHHYDDISAQHFKRRKGQHKDPRDRSGPEQFAGRLPFRRRSLRDSPTAPSHSPAVDSRFYATLPDKIKKRQFTREEQVVLARHLRASVILDAADEAVYKIGRRSSRNLQPLQLQPDNNEHTLNLSSQSSMESLQSDMAPPVQHAQGPKIAGEAAPESFFDTFRWLDEEEDLDLRLFLDDYHANLREALPMPTKERRPSFRRHLSITKIPFGRPSVSSSRPATKDASTPTSPFPQSPTVAGAMAPVQHARRKSRALSLITPSPRHSPSESITAIDPAAAHYQDPEARLKLRVYLASPQKFDEAIEFGFPSADALSAAPVITSGPLKRKERQKLSDDSENLRSFLEDGDDDDDDVIGRFLDSDQGSMPDPESPRTPLPMERPLGSHPVRTFTEPTHTMHRPLESYAQVPANSREMTLRMTLTRPDLRANEDQIYGWQQQQQGFQPGRKSQSSPLRDELTTPLYIGEAKPKESIDQVFAGIDHWGPDPADRGVMKRFWNRVRRS